MSRCSRRSKAAANQVFAEEMEILDSKKVRGDFYQQQRRDRNTNKSTAPRTKIKTSTTKPVVFAQQAELLFAHASGAAPLLVVTLAQPLGFRSLQ